MGTALVIAVALAVIGAMVAARRRTWGSRVGCPAWFQMRPGSGLLATGDPALDGLVDIHGDEQRVLAALGADVRANLGTLARAGAVAARGAWTLPHAALVPYAASVSAALLAATIDDLIGLAASDPLPSVRRRCLRALRGTPHHGDAARRAMSDPDPRTRAAAARELGDVATLRTMVLDQAVPPEVRLEIVGSMRPSEWGEAALIPLLNDPLLSEAAIAGLAQVGGADAVRALRECAPVREGRRRTMIEAAIAVIAARAEHGGLTLSPVGTGDLSLAQDGEVSTPSPRSDA